MKNQTRKSKVFVGLSGGVDSSVSAALLKRQGFDVTGVFIKVWTPPFLEPARTVRSGRFGTGGPARTGSGGCTWKDDRLDAMRVCAKLQIPFITLNLEKEYKKEVVDYMIAEYKSGKTPNPDVMCNKQIKFGAFYQWAMKQGADFVATGHYARIEHDTNTLMVANDTNKDQSYFLWQLRREQLPRILFPIGGMKKSEVRKLAKKLGLVTAEKKDSQGLCFMGKIDVKEFLKHFIAVREGVVLDERGNKIGWHPGSLLFTLGERHGFAVIQKTSRDKPWYVVKKNSKRNTITVSHTPLFSVPEVFYEAIIEDVNWISGKPPSSTKQYLARVRYRAPLTPCRIKINGSKAVVYFGKTILLPSGQSIVFYDGDVCYGGGIIS